LGRRICSVHAPGVAHLDGSSIVDGTHCPRTHVVCASQGMFRQAPRRATGRSSPVCGTNRNARRATMQPLYSGATHWSAGTSTPATTLKANAASLPLLGTIVIEPIRPAEPTPHAVVEAVAGLVSMSPLSPTVIVVDCSMPQLTSVVSSAETSVAV